MNWIEIEKEFPKSFNLCLSLNKNLILNKKGILINKENFQIFDPRDLYNFFDSKNLYVDITPNFYIDGISWLYQVNWYTDEKYNIKNNYKNFLDGTFAYGDDGEYLSREIAEEEAFKNCFGLLELRLK